MRRCNSFFGNFLSLAGLGRSVDLADDMTVAGLLASHLLWAAESGAAHNQAFNVVMATYSAGNGCGVASLIGSG